MNEKLIKTLKKERNKLYSGKLMVIPKEFEEHFNQNKFKDSFERIMADIKRSLKNRDCSYAGRYEYETIEILEKVFEDSKTAYDINKAVEYVRCRCYELGLDESQTEIIVSEIVKQGGASDDMCKCRRLKGYNFLHKTICGDVFEMEYGYKFCPYCGKKIKIVGE